MRYNVTPAEIINEVYNIYSDPARLEDYTRSDAPQYIGVCGWAGVMSPANRAAFVAAFGTDTVETAETLAAARVAAYRAAYDASEYHRHELTANEADPAKVPAVGSFVWCLTDWMKCEGGPMDPLKNHCEEWGEFRRVLVEIAAVVTVPAADLLKADTAHRVAREYTGHQGGRYEESDPLRLDGRPYAWTVGVLVTDGARWYIVDSEGYDWARYVLMPKTMATMYAPELAELAAARDRREAEEAARLQAAADERRRVYLERCARWEGAELVDVRPLDAAAAEASKVHGWRSKEAKSAQRKADSARRRNILTMCQAAAPGVKFSVRKWDGWGGSYEVSWTDGPTADSLKAAADLDLLESGRDTFNGYDDSTGTTRAEFQEFAAKYLGVFGEIRTDRETSPEFRAEIVARIREAVPGLPEGDQTPTDGAQAWKVADAITDTADRYNVADLAERYGLREVAAYVARITSRPTTSEAPTDPTPGGTGADAAPYGESQKSQISDDVEACQLPEVKEYRLMYLFGAWVCHCRIYAETDDEAIHDAMDEYITSSLPRWPYRVALWEDSRLVRDIKDDGPDAIGRRDMEQEKDENGPVYVVRDASKKAQCFRFDDYVTRSILLAASYIIKETHTAGSRRLQLYADGVKLWDGDENTKTALAYIVRKRLCVPYGAIQKSPICEATAAAAELEAEELAENTAEYDRLKAKHHDALLLFRVGEFYEMWHDDAETAADVLGLILTRAHGGLKVCAFPAVALDTYLPKLVRAGHRLAICDDPRPKRSPRPKKATA